MKLPYRLIGLVAWLSVATVVPGKTPEGKPVALLLAGKPSHGPGEHEHNAGVLLLAKCLAQGAPSLVVKTHLNAEWPSKSELAEADTILFYCDGGEHHMLLEGNRLSDLAREMKRGAGLVALHYAVEFPTAKGGPEALQWLGGYFEINWSVNPVWDADFKTLPKHPVTRGVTPFGTNDEWYYHMRFKEGPGRRTDILSAVPPLSSLSRPDGEHSGNPAVRAEVAAGRVQTMSWTYERAGGGRAFAFTGGHAHQNWGIDNQRKLVLNAILWTAGLDVPTNGVESKVTAADLSANLDVKPVKPPAPAPVAAAEPPPEIVPPSLFTAPEGFEVTIWARAPMVRNPTNMDIDAKGRIWITEGVNYRKHAGRDPKGDRIVILEDTNGNGRADKATVFVQEPGLETPLGIAVIDNQVVVSATPDLVVYTDIDRDGKFDPRVDRREVLLTGFNGRNHDHSLHSVTFGPDGLWYFNHGNAGAAFTDRSGKTFRVGDAYDPGVAQYGWRTPDIAGATSDDGHVYVGGFTVRMNPDATHAEIIGYNYRNCYEQCVTSFGDLFQNDNDDPPACRTSFLMEYGNAGFFSRDGTRLWQADRRPGQSIQVAEWRQDDPGVMPAGDVYGAGAPTGIVSYESDAIGAKWSGMILSAEAGLNTIFGYFPKADGAGYKLERFIFLTTNREREFAGLDSLHGKVSTELKTWFRPSDVAVGPDGAIYVADWFDPRVGGHQDLDDKTAGAIYRIAPKGFKSVIPTFDLATTAGQITALKSPAINVRASGYLRLRAQGAAAVAPVAALLSDANPFVRARAVWLLPQLGPAGVGLVEAQLHSADPMMRVAAFRSLRRLGRGTPAYARMLATDPSPAVRREVALALRDVPLAESRDLLLSLARGYDGLDRTYLEAWGTGCSGKEAEIFAALAAAQPEKNAAKWPASYAHLVWRLTPAAAVADFAVRARAESLSDHERVAAVTALGFIPTAEAAHALLDLAEKAQDPVKAQAFWWLLNYQDSRWRDFGVAAELKRRGLYDPDTLVISAAIAPPAPPTQLPPASAIAALIGDPRRGAGYAQICQMCHRIGGNGVDYAPDLTGFANRQTAEVVIDAIRDPSADIAHGYDGTELVLKDGTVIDGLLQSEGEPLVIQSTGGRKQLVPQNRVKSRQRLVRSLMLSADQLGLKAQDLADIVAYLKTQN